MQARPSDSAVLGRILGLFCGGQGKPENRHLHRGFLHGIKPFCAVFSGQKRAHPSKGVLHGRQAPAKLCGDLALMAPRGNCGCQGAKLAVREAGPADHGAGGFYHEGQNERKRTKRLGLKSSYKVCKLFYGGLFQ